MPFLQGKTISTTPAFTSLGDHLRALRTEQQKLILKRTNGKTVNTTLFNLADDPMEQNDLAPGSPWLVKRLTDTLEHMMTLLEDSAKATKRSTISKEVAEELDQLGYVGER